MPDTGPTISKIVTSSTSFVEKAVEFRHFMLFTAFLLILDSCLVVFFNKSLTSAFQSTSDPEVSASNALIFLGLFFFSMSLFFPAIRQLMRLAIGAVYFKWFWDSNSNSKLGTDWDFPSLKKREAIINKDSFVLDIIYKHESELMDKNINLNVGFSLIFIFVINYFALGNDTIQTLTQQASLLLDVDFGFWINRLINAGIAVFLFFIFTMLLLSLDPNEEDRVYIPSNSDRDKVSKTKNSDLGKA